MFKTENITRNRGTLYERFNLSRRYNNPKFVWNTDVQNT